MQDTIHGPNFMVRLVLKDAEAIVDDIKSSTEKCLERPPGRWCQEERLFEVAFSMGYQDPHKEQDAIFLATPDSCGLLGCVP